MPTPAPQAVKEALPHEVGSAISLELPQDVHPFYVATQAHPEFKSRPTKPHPLFAGLVKAALDHQAAR